MYNLDSLAYKILRNPFTPKLKDHYCTPSPSMTLHKRHKFAMIIKYKHSFMSKSKKPESIHKPHYVTSAPE